MRILLLLALAAPLAAQTTVQPFQGGTGIDTSTSTGCPSITSGVWSVVACGGGGGGGSLLLLTNGIANNSQAILNFITSTTNATGLISTPVNVSSTEKFELSGLVNQGHGGTGVNNTATLTLGTANHNYATLGTGILKNTTTTGALSVAASSDIYSLWSGTCNSSTFLRGDGTCSTPAGSGTTGTVGKLQKTDGSGGHVASSITDNGTTVTMTEPVFFTATGIPIATGTTSNTDLGGFITLSTGTGTYSFTATYATAPICVVSETTDATKTVKGSASTTVLTVTGTGSDVIAFICIGRT